MRFLFIIIYQGPVFIVWAWMELYSGYSMDSCGALAISSGLGVSYLIDIVGSSIRARKMAINKLQVQPYAPANNEKIQVTIDLANKSKWLM